ncbi:carnitine dehydratase [Microbulbifer agarilyticus]|uniref:Carnitine dehydratase n=1 Tax=Microbulbifer agarilyticus TaxID=260552 RepID=A0A1Q2M3J7_9GAMM|nr:CaiB/BaiF CoA-transferase family protein [Microbulbifer agarilyticus]AQQ67236.1 carnitine dehydratase [Microbulbifer agarilyticus]
MTQPLKGITVLEFSQYLAGPYAGLRLADLGARVIKIERPGSGDACRNLATKDLWVDGDSLLFHTINRNKESFCADLKNPGDLAAVRQLIRQADVMTHNFRPGVMEKIGLDYTSVQAINPRIIYGEVSGYGNEGPWVHKPGQDLLAQAVSGLGWLSGNRDQGPVPLGLAIADMLCGTHLAQGVLAALVRRQRATKYSGNYSVNKGAEGIEAGNTGAKVQVSLLESMIDFQFEGLTTYLNNGQQSPSRSEIANAHTFLGAPYGIYQTKDHWIAISMGPLGPLAEALACPALNRNDIDKEAFSQRDTIKATLAEHLRTQSTDYWMQRLNAAAIWASEVVDYDTLLQHPAFKAVAMELQVSRSAQNAHGNEVTVTTTRCPLQINGQRFTSHRAAPVLGADTAHIRQTLLAKQEVAQ